MRRWKRATKRVILTALACIMLTGTAATAYAYADETEETRTERSSEGGSSYGEGSGRSAGSKGTESRENGSEAGRSGSNSSDGSGTTVLDENLSETGSGSDKDPDEKKDADSTKEEKEDSEGEKIDRSSAFTTLGSAQVKDDIKDGSSKEFLTIVTKNNQTFYLVIDRSATTDNVYLLSNVDENDLEEFLDEAAGNRGEEASPSVLLPELTREQEETTAVKEEETEEKEKKGFFTNSTGFMLVVLLAVLAGLGCGYYFKIYRPRMQEEDDSDNEGLEDDQGYEEIDEG